MRGKRSLENKTKEKKQEHQRTKEQRVYVSTEPFRSDPVASYYPIKGFGKRGRGQG